MFVIGHRGAPSLGPENTIYGIKRAIEVGVDAVEIDVQITAGNRLAVIHDSNLKRIANDPRKVKELSLGRLQLLPTISGEPIPSLEEALEASGTTLLIIEGKGSGWAKPLAKVLESSKSKNVKVISFNELELAKFHKQVPSVPVWLIGRTSANRCLHLAKVLNFDGIDVHYWLLSLHIYWQARKAGKDIAVFGVNHAWIARFLKRFFPEIWVTTNVPQKMQHLRD